MNTSLFEQLAARSEQQKRFLEGLAHDYQQYFYYCFTCSKVRLRKHVAPSGPLQYRTRKGLQCQDRQWSSNYLGWITDMYDNFSSYLLQFVYVQIVLDEFRHGRGHELPLSTVRHNEVRVHSPIDFNGLTHEVLSIDAEDLHNKLCLRAQQWIIFGPPRDQGSTSRIFWLRFCAHVDQKQSRGTFEASQLPVGRSGLPARAKLLSCPICRTEYSTLTASSENLYGLKRGHKGFAGVATKYLVLGECYDLNVGTWIPAAMICWTAKVKGSRREDHVSWRSLRQTLRWGGSR